MKVWNQCSRIKRLIIIECFCIAYHRRVTHIRNIDTTIDIMVTDRQHRLFDICHCSAVLVATIAALPAITASPGKRNDLNLLQIER
ncbi:hypothetical protein OK016_23430 [Vibrio chagasii]|nr:hypothetical protein [Vibrio chagasii]